MSAFMIFLVLLGVLAAGEVVARVRRRAKRTVGTREGGATDSEGHCAPELEHRRRLDLRASRWPGPEKW